MLLALLTAVAIGSGPAQDDGVIAGQVVDGVSGKPMAAAVVSLTGSSLIGVPPASQPPRILTGADGRFIFRNLPPGVFSVVAAKGGYADGEPGRRRPGGSAPPLVISDTDRALNVTVPMWKYGAIAGTVIDEAGEPVVALQVRALKRAAAGGLRRFTIAATTFTDDRGAYRFGDLVPADYVVVASPPPFSANVDALTGVSGTGRGHGRMIALLGPPQTGTVAAVNVGRALLAASRGYAVPPPAGSRVQMYPPTFYPSAPAPGSASTIAVASGEERAANIQLAPLPAVRLSGTLMATAGPVQAALIQLIPAGTDGIPSEAVAPETVTDNQGGFVFAAVMPGRYSMRAQIGGPFEQAWIDMPVTVGDQDVDGVVAMMRPPLRVTGRLQFDGNTPPPAMAPSGFTTAPFNLAPAEGTLDKMSIAGMFEAQGFTMSGYLPGRYRVHVVDPPRGWMFKAAMLDGVDVSETPFDLTRDVPDLALLFTDRWSGVTGTVGQGADRAVVLLFTADTQAWADAGPNSKRFRTARANLRGEFGMSGVLPGEYYLVAIPEEASADWRDPSSLDGLARIATRIAIAEGETKRIGLRVVEVPR
jgi:hypothetical protein